jgi:hypothetical protein
MPDHAPSPNHRRRIHINELSKGKVYEHIHGDYDSPKHPFGHFCYGRDGVGIVEECAGGGCNAKTSESNHAMSIGGKYYGQKDDSKN